MAPTVYAWEGTEPLERMGCCYINNGCFEIQSNKGAKLRP